jgi:hypothetical protein
MKWSEFFGYILGIIVFGLILALILTYPMMLLWNWLMPYIFGLPTLTFWQMLGFSILLDCLIPHSFTNTNNK